MNKINKKSLDYVLYARKSTEDANKQIQSIEDQVRIMKAKAKQNGYNIVAVRTDEKSGGKPGIRDGFNEMIELIETGKANGILAWKLDRISRNPQDSGYIHQMMNDGKLRCIVTDARDYTEDDDIMFDVESSMDARFRKDLMKNVRRGMYSKADKGWMPCVPPIGYINDRYEKTIVPDPETWDKMRQVFDKFLTGVVTVPELVEYADKELGLRTHQRRKTGGKPLSYTGMLHALSNVFYVGKFTYGHKEYNGNHPALISEEERERVLAILNQSRRNIKLKDKTEEKPKRLLGGLVKCAICGYSIIGDPHTKHYKNGTTQEFLHYHCSGQGVKKTGIKCPQKGICIPEEELIAQIKAELAKYTIDPDFFKLAVEALAEEDEARIADQDKKMNELRKQRDQRVSELTNLRQLRYKNIITDDSYFIDESENLENQIKACEKAIAKAEAASRDWRQVANDVFMFAKYAKEDFDSDDLERKRYVIKTLGGKLELKARTLIFTPSKYLIPIQKAVSQTKEARETARTCDLQGSEDLKRTLISTWYTRRDSNPRPNVPKTFALIH